MTDKMLTLNFTAQRLDYIAQVLMQRPYAEVAPVLADIQAQIAQQQAPAAAPAAPNGHDPDSPLPVQ